MMLLITHIMFTFACLPQAIDALADIPAALPPIRGSNDAPQEQPVVEIIAAGITFDDDVVAGLDRVLRRAARLQAAYRRPFDFPHDGSVGLQVRGLQLYTRVRIRVGELKTLAFELGTVLHEIAPWDGMMREGRAAGKR